MGKPVPVTKPSMWPRTNKIGLFSDEVVEESVAALKGDQSRPRGSPDGFFFVGPMRAAQIAQKE